ncbi:MAG: acyl-CoA dehydrogenase family protein [Sagittula sp.]|uniref:acyl-CoA dehydrogenase family protein n=1 Tax=Sagittula sp. TaxID=2038081 RepID=UPI0040596E56
MTPTSNPTAAVPESAESYRLRLRDFIAAEITPYQDRFISQRHVDRAIWREAGRQGLLLPDLPVEHGGGGGDFRHVAAIFEERAAADDRSFGMHVHLIVAHYIDNYGTADQKARILPRLASGEWIGAIAMTEPGAGSDLKTMETEARADGNGYVVNGVKNFISNAYQADILVLAAKTAPDAGPKGVSLLLVETADLPGFKVEKVMNKIGQAGQDTCEISFSDVRLPGDALLGQEGRGFAQLMRDLAYERMIVAVSAAATIERVVKLTTEHARTRPMFGGTLFDLQNTRFVLAEAQTKAKVARVLVDSYTERLLAGDLDAADAAAAKLWLTETEWEVVDSCLQLFGGYGYLHDFPISRIFIDARVERVYGGASEVMKEIVARSL